MQKIKYDLLKLWICDQILKQMRTNIERNLEDSVDSMKNSIASNHIKKNNKCASFLWLHLEKVGY